MIFISLWITNYLSSLSLASLFRQSSLIGYLICNYIYLPRGLQRHRHRNKRNEPRRANRDSKAMATKGLGHLMEQKNSYTFTSQRMQRLLPLVSCL